MTEEQAEKSVERFRRVLELQSAVSYSDLHRKSPVLEFANDEAAYYAPDEHKIHLGTYLPLRVFDPKDETDLYNAFVYLHGHEEQHSRSTSKGYEIAIDLGCRKVVEYISGKIEKGGHRFRNRNDYESYANHVFPKHGISLPWNAIHYFVTYLANSVEDGRIERIRCHLYKGYKPFVQYHRGLFWEQSGGAFPPYDRIKDQKAVWLEILFGEALTLATCQLFSRGFLETYEDTPIFEEVKRMLPYIAECVKAGSSRKMQEPLVKICEIIAPYLLELGKMAQEDSDHYGEFLCELLEQISGDLMDTMMEKSSLRESDEETDDGSIEPLFSHSDLIPEKEPSKEGEGKSNEATDKKETIQKEIENAMENARDTSEEMITEIHKDETRARKKHTKVVEDNDAELTVEMIEDICDKFKENKRTYRLSSALPPVLMARGKALLQKNQRYFRSLSRLNILNQSSGSLDSSRISDLAMGDIHIFRKKGKERVFDGCAYILVDNSGSMRGAKKKAAFEAASVIEEGFRGLVPIKIVAFDYDDLVIHEVVKGWNEQQKLNCSYNFLLHGRNGFSNVDAYDIRIATKELVSRREEKKMLVVLSDGLPCCETGKVTSAIEQARRLGIKVIGIYFDEGRIGEDAEQFKAMYKKDYICCTESEIDSFLIKEFIKFARS